MNRNKLFKELVWVMILCLFRAQFSPAIAGEKASRGNIAITFHENKASRIKSDRFKVTQDNGDVRWENYGDEKPAAKGKTEQVYEIKDGFRIRTAAAKAPSEHQNAKLPSSASQTAQ